MRRARRAGSREVVVGCMVGVGKGSEKREEGRPARGWKCAGDGAGVSYIWAV